MSVEKEFVPYNRALRMKALGFDEPCFASWSYTYELQNYVELKLGYIIDGPRNYTNAPTFSQVFRFFREKYDLDGETCRYNLSHSEAKILGINLKEIKFKYLAVINGEDFPELNDMLLYDSREEAELACLDKLLEIVESKSE